MPSSKSLSFRPFVNHEQRDVRCRRTSEAWVAGGGDPARARGSHARHVLRLGESSASRWTFAEAIPRGGRVGEAPWTVAAELALEVENRREIGFRNGGNGVRSVALGDDLAA